MADFYRKSISKGLRFKILTRDRFRCYYCGISSLQAALHIDHVIPVAAGGSTDEANLVAACKDCNLGKSASAIIPPSHREIEYEDWLIVQMEILEDRSADLDSEELEEFEIEACSDTCEEDVRQECERLLERMEAAQWQNAAS